MTTILERFDGFPNNAKSLTRTERAVFAIAHDISGRRGLKQEWDNIDGEMKGEILSTWIEILLEHDLE